VSQTVVGLGAGGHAKVIIEILKADDRYDLVGCLEPAPSRVGESVLGVPILGDDDLLGELVEQGVSHFFVGAGHVRDGSTQRRLFELGSAAGLAPVTVIHSAAIVSPSATVGRGATILAGAILNTGAVIGDNVVLNSAAIVEHDCVVGDHVHVASGACLAGGVSVGRGSLVGAGAVVRQGVMIGRDVIVGAGAVVVSDVPAGTTVVGVPARPLRTR
jgi:UDP-perosamine 4-acetyltransferase